MNPCTFFAMVRILASQTNIMLDGFFRVSHHGFVFKYFERMEKGDEAVVVKEARCIAEFLV